MRPASTEQIGGQGRSGRRCVDRSGDLAQLGGQGGAGDRERAEPAPGGAVVDAVAVGGQRGVQGAQRGGERA